MFLNQPALHMQQGYERFEGLSLSEVGEKEIQFLTQAGTMQVCSYAPGVLRLRIQSQPRPDYGLLQAPAETAKLAAQSIPEGWMVQIGDLSLEVLSSPVRLRLLKQGKRLLESATDRTIQGGLRLHPLAYGHDGWLLSFALGEGEAVYGLGEKFTSLNRRGQLLTSWNEDATTLNAELSYKNVPFAWSPTGWGLFVHTTSRLVHGVGYPSWSHRSYVIQVHDPNLDLFLLTADSPAEMLKRYTHLTGRAPLPPRWSYGMWMSRAYYRTADEALEAATTMREREIPCDVILLDGRAWHKMETRFDFQWDPDRYPHPATFVQSLRQLGIRLNLWEYPYISVKNPLFNHLAERGFLLQTSSGDPYIHRWLPRPFDELYPHLMPSGIIDFTHPEAYAWYRDQHRPLHELGVSVMKTDYGESIPEDAVAHNGDSGAQLHNVYALLYNRCVFEAAARYSGDGAIVWGRAGWTGSQCLPVQWGGDPQCDWGGLAASIRGGLSWGLSGGAFYSHDIGGFAVGMPDPELYVRWAQAGIMLSHTRFHGLGPREPWHYGPDAEAIVKKWLAWRYRLIPYLQACALMASEEGMPVMRAMPLAFPRDPLSWPWEHQYMLGPSLLVVPVIQAGGEVQFYLPGGRWYDIWQETWLQGPGVITRTVPLDTIPMFGREGTLLPLGPAVQHTGELKPDLDLEEIWTFGTPREGLPLPGLDLAHPIAEALGTLGAPLKTFPLSPPVKDI